MLISLINDAIIQYYTALLYISESSSDPSGNTCLGLYLEPIAKSPLLSTVCLTKVKD